MEVRLTPEQQQVIDQAVASGRYASAEEALNAVLVLLDNHRKLAALRTLIDEGDADLEAGRYTEYTDETLADLFVELRREARASLDNEQIERL